MEERGDFADWLFESGKESYWDWLEYHKNPTEENPMKNAVVFDFGTEGYDINSDKESITLNTEPWD